MSANDSFEPTGPSPRNSLVYSLLCGLAGCLFLFSVVPASPLSAAGWYVNDDSTTNGDVYTTAVGNDSNSGSSSDPFRTINKALSVSSTSDSIYVDGGTFNESVTIDTGGLHLIGVDSGTTIIDGSGLGSVNGVETTDGNDNVTIKQLAIKNFGDFGIELQDSTNNTIKNVLSKNNASAGFYHHSPQAGGNGNNHFEDNRAVSNGAAGFELAASDDNTLIDNESINNGTYGFELFNASNNTFRNNGAHNNAQDGITLVFGSQNNTVRENSFTDNSEWQIRIGASPQTLDKNNIDPSSTNPDSGIVNNATDGLSLTRHYWNTTDTTSIDARVQGSNTTDFTPFRLGPVDTAPGVDVVAPDTPANLSADTSTSGQIDLSWTASSGDEDGTAQTGFSEYRVYRTTDPNETNWKSNAFLTGTGSVPADNSYTDNAVTGGQTYYYRITAVDDKTLENESFFSHSVRARATTDKPILDLTDPTAGAYHDDVSGTYVITDFQESTGDVEVQYSPDGGSTWNAATVSGDINNVSMSTSGDTHSFTWDSVSDLGASAYNTNVKLRARGDDGTNVGDWDTSPVFTVDNQPPIVSFDHPPAGSKINNNLLLEASPSDNDAVAEVRFWRGSVGGTLIGTDTEGSNGWTTQWNTTGLSDGTYSVHVEAVDSAGNTATDNRSFDVDNSDPTVSISSPSDGSTVTDTFTVEASASDNDAVDRVEFTKNGGTNITGSGNARTIQFEESFSSAPVVLAQIQNHDDQEVTVQIKNVNTNSFDLYVCGHNPSDVDDCGRFSKNYSVAWIAIQPGSNPFSSTSQVGTATDIGSSSWTSQSFSLTDIPAVAASIQTNNGGQEHKPSMARNVTSSSMDVRYCEHDGGDICDGHAAEDVGWFAFEPGAFGAGAGEADTQSTPANGGWTFVDIANTYDTPVIVSTSNTESESESPKVAHVRESVFGTGQFEVRVCEHENQSNCDAHAREDAGWMVFDLADVKTTSGVDGGVVFRAGVDVNSSGGWSTKIPPQPTGTSIDLNAIGYDESGNEMRSKTHTVTVDRDKIYVNDSSVDASDSWTTAPGDNSNLGTKDSPFRTLNKAYSVSNSGDSIYIDAGDFVDNEDIDTPGLYITGVDSGVTSVSSPEPGGFDDYGPDAFDLLADGITVRNLSVSNGTINIDMNRNNGLVENVTAGDYGDKNISINNADNTVRNSEIRESNTSSAEATVWVTDDNVTVQNNFITGSGQAGVYLWGADNTLVENNRIENSSWDGILIRECTAGGCSGDNANSNTIRGNELTNNDDGITLHSNGTTSWNTIEENEIQSSNGDGINLSSSQNTIRNNLVADATAHGINVDGNNQTIIENEFKNNRNWEINIAGGSGHTIRRNNLKPSGGKGIRNQTSNDFGTTRNYWNSTDTTTINGYTSESGGGDVDYTPFRLGEVDTAAGVDVVAPDTPSGVTADNSVLDQITLDWTASSGDEDGSGMSGFEEYRVYRTTDPNETDWKSNAFLASTGSAPSDNSYTDNSVTRGEVYYYRITAVDDKTLENESFFSQSVKVRAQSLEPLLDLKNPTAGTYREDVSGTYVIKDFQESSGSIDVQYSPDGGSTWNPATVSGEVSNVSMSSSGDTHSFSWDSVSDLGGNAYNTTVKLRARGDDGSHKGEWDTSPVFTVDNQAPTLSFDHPPSNSNINNSLTLEASASDPNSGVNEVRFWRGSVGGTLIGTDSDGSDGWTVQWDTTGLPDGNESVVVEAVDPVGNTATVSRNFSLDNTNPSVSLSSPADGGTLSGTTTITASASDNDAVDRVEFTRNGNTSLVDDTSSRTIYFDESFSDTPIVVAQIQNHDTSEVITQVKNVNRNSFEIYICGVDPDNDNHCGTFDKPYTVAWVAISPSSNPYSLVSQADATLDINNSNWTSQSLSLSDVPAVAATIQTDDGFQQHKPSMARNVTSSSMDIRYCEHDLGDNCDNHNAEDVGWFAFEPGAFGSGAGEADTQSAPVDGNWTMVDIQDNFDEPVVVASSNTENETEPPKVVHVRETVYNRGQFEVRVCEHENQNNCDTHAREDAGWIVFDLADLPSTSGVDGGVVFRTGVDADPAGGWSTELGIGNLATGSSHDLHAVAYDESGNEVRSTTHSVTVDRDKIYVNDSSLDASDSWTTAPGDDSNLGTADSPFGSISKALSVSNVNDTIYVDAGTFNESVSIDTGGLAVVGADSGVTVLDGGGLGSVNGISVTDGNNNVVIQDLTVQNYGNFGIELEDSTGNRVFGVLLKGNGASGMFHHSPQAGGKGNNRFEYIRAENNGAAGIELGASNDNTLVNNTLLNNGSHGLQLFNASNNTIRHNRIDSNGANGVLLDNLSTGNTLEQNRFANNTNWQIRINAGSHTIEKNNLHPSSTHPDSGILNESSNDLSVIRNWYGTSDSGVINTRTQNTGGGSLDHLPFRLGEVDTAPGADTVAPNAPGSVTANSPDDFNINVSWTASSGDEESDPFSPNLTGYRVYRATSPGANQWTLVADVNSSTTNYTDNPPATGTYYYRVTAYDNHTPDNESYYSSSIGSATVSDTSLANTWYVNDGSLDASDSWTTRVGNDAHSGLDPDTPLRTIRAVEQKLTKGDSVYIDAGTFSDTFTIDTDAVTVVGVDSGVTVIENPEPNPDNDDVPLDLSGDTITVRNLAAINGQQNIRMNERAGLVEGVRVENSAGNNVGIYGDNNTLRNSRLDGQNNDMDNLYLATNTNNTVRNNVIIRANQNGIVLLSTSDNTIRNNRIHNNGTGIDISGSDGNYIRGNAITNNNGPGLVNDGDNTIVLNEFADNDGWQIDLEGGNPELIKNNLDPSATNPDSGVRNDASANLSLTRHYWNTADSTVIESRVGGSKTRQYIPFRLGEVDTGVGADTVAPNAPSSVSVAVTGDSTLTVSWTASSGDEEADPFSPNLTGYRVYRSTERDTGAWTEVADVGSGTTSYEDGGLKAGQTYYYRVTAYDDHTPENESYFSVINSNTARIFGDLRINRPSNLHDTNVRNIAVTGTVEDADDGDSLALSVNGRDTQVRSINAFDSWTVSPVRLTDMNDRIFARLYQSDTTSTVDDTASLIVNYDPIADTHPNSLAVMDTGPDTVALSWSAFSSDPDTGTGFDRYVIYYEKNNRPDSTSPTLSSGSMSNLSTNSGTVDGLEIVTNYQFRIGYVDQVGNRSILSDTVGTRTAGPRTYPDAPVIRFANTSMDTPHVADGEDTLAIKLTLQNRAGRGELLVDTGDVQLTGQMGDTTHAHDLRLVSDTSVNLAPLTTTTVRWVIHRPNSTNRHRLGGFDKHLLRESLTVLSDTGEVLGPPGDSLPESIPPVQIAAVADSRPTPLNTPDTWAAALQTISFAGGVPDGEAAFDTGTVSSGDTIIVYTQRGDTDDFDTPIANPAYGFTDQESFISTIQSADREFFTDHKDPIPDGLFTASLWRNQIGPPDHYVGSPEDLGERVRVTIRRVPFAGRPESIEVAKLKPSTNAWVVVDSGPRVTGPEGNRTVTFTVSAESSEEGAGFSVFRVISGGIARTGSAGDVIVYPNPFKPHDGNPSTGEYGLGPGQGIHFGAGINRGFPAGTVVRIYNVLGERIDTLRSMSGGILQWDARTRNGDPVASGVYVFRIKTPDGATKVGKLTIIR